MTSPKMKDENYVKLAQIYNIVIQRDKIDEYFGLSRKKMKIKAIMDNDFDKNYKLPFDCLISQRKSQYSGNTVSHFIIEFSDYLSNYFDVLIESSFDLTIQNDRGCTPLLLAFLKGKNVNEILHYYLSVKNFKNFKCKNGISHFHAACSTNLIEIINNYLKAGVYINERVNEDSLKFGGYTPLHFAMEYFQLQTIELLLKNGASLNSKNTNGMTPLHLLIKKLLLNKYLNDIKLQIFLQDAVSNNLFDLPDDVGFTLTHLRSILGKFENKKDINIDAQINSNSPILPGYTPLHFAAELNFKTVTLLLKAGADLLAKDCKGITPFDLCLERFNNYQIIKVLLIEKRHQLSRIKFTNGVLLLEVLKAMQENIKFEKYLKQKFVDINNIIPLDSPIWPGCSLLHLVVIFDGPVHKMLSFPNINHAIQDAKGMSPLHIAFRMKRVDIITTLLDNFKFTSSYSLDQDNLSYLHIACATENIEAVKLLLKNGVDPNLPTLCDIQWKLTDDCNIIKAGSTPLHIAVHLAYTENSDYINVLMEYKAKPNIADVNGITPYYIALKYERETIFDKMLKSDKDFYSKKEYELLGLTRLQIACFIHDLSMVKEELASGADVNKQISFDSKIWPGDTALHTLCRKSFESRNEFIKQLLAKGADPYLQNASDSTPVHLSNGEIFHTLTHLLGINFFNKNPENNQGLSHFHMACIAGNLIAVENFLKTGISINAAVDYFADYCAGFTPLHIAVWKDNVKLIELLFNYGADPNIISSEGSTPLHLAVITGKNDSLRKLMSYPTLNIQTENLFGETALEINLRLYYSDENVTKILLEKGAYLNFSILTDNRYGSSFIFRILKKIHDIEIFQKLIANGRDITISDDEGNNLIHHIISDNYIDDACFWDVYKEIEILVDNGCEIDHKNNEGKTPLHFAVSLENRVICEILLELGADINIKDDDKKTPYFYDSYDVCKLTIMKHILKLESIGFYIDKSNELDSDARDFYNNFDNHDYNPPFLEEDLSTIAREKELLDFWLKKEINPTFSATDIFSNQFLKDFKSIPESQRQKILIESCRSEDEEDCYPVLQHLIKVQFNRAQKWNRLFVPAANSFQVLSGLTVSEMCLEIVKHLDIGSLMNLVRAVNGKLEYPPLIENN